ncbi:hypothetical protein [Streptomyces poriticola]|uniref:hypothetical protein n=1 Tax=Streptomyces poriticola TaxID=3120506 RepID=UPI002FCE4D4D
MEQRIGSSSKPLEGAGFDPAFIPGLTSPAAGEPKDTEPEDATPEDAQPADAEPGGAGTGEAGRAEEAAVGGRDEQRGGESEEAAADPDGPVFEASDRRARMVADHRGVRLGLDDQECEFRWDEIGAVETETARFGKRFTVTVHTPERRWYPIEIEAKSRSDFKEWEAALDRVLDAYFDDGDDSEDADGVTRAPEGKPAAKKPVQEKPAEEKSAE